MNKFIAARPTVGGWLTIANIVAVLGLALTGEYFSPALAAGVIVLLSLPLSWIMLIPVNQPPQIVIGIAQCLLIGINAFLWGYGLAWLIPFLTPLRLRKAK